jgi:hypothetical protein
MSGNAIIELGTKFYASSSGNDSVIKYSLSTTNNGGGGTAAEHSATTLFILDLTHPAPLLVSSTAPEAYCGGTQHCHDDFWLHLTYPAPLLVLSTGSNAYLSTVLCCFIVCRVGSG